MSSTSNRAGVLAATTALVLGALVGALAPGAQAAPNVPDIARGSRNTVGVKCVQEGVDDWAKRTGRGWPLAVDGVFGDNTKKWVEKFQTASFGASGADGIVGPRTGNSILDNLNGDTRQGFHWRSECYNQIPSSQSKQPR